MGFKSFLFFQAGMIDRLVPRCTSLVAKTRQLDFVQIIQKHTHVKVGATKLTSLQSLYIKTRWESLASRRQKSKLVLLYKMQNEMTPDYLSSLASPTVGSTTRYR